MATKANQKLNPYYSMPIRSKLKSVTRAVLLVSLLALLSGSKCRQPQLSVTSVGKSVATLQQTSSITGCGATAPPILPKEPQDWWNEMPPANRQYPFAGWQVFQTGVGGCAATRIDAYRTVVTFNLGAVSNLRGLV